MRIIEYFNQRRLSAPGLLGFVLSLGIVYCAHALPGGESTGHSGPHTELLMIESASCVYCAKFDREIAPAYSHTAEGTLAPLRRLQLSEPWPDDLQQVKSSSVTPTFILVVDGIEIDRLLGYPGDDHFWFLLNEMLEKRP